MDREYDRSVKPAMPASGRGVRLIRQSKPVRMFSAAYIAIVAAVMLGGAIGSAGWVALLVTIPFAALFCWPAYRQFRMSVEVHPEKLVVRNRIRTWTIPRADIDGFAGGPYEFGIDVMIRGHQRVQLGVTARPTFFRRGRDRREYQLAELSRWWETTRPVDPEVGNRSSPGE